MTRRLLGRAGALALALLLSVPASAHPAPGDPGEIVHAEAAWILTCVTAEGAITLTPERDVIVPYDASIAAWGLARAAAVTGDATFAEAAWGWLKWYATHQQPWTGFVTERVLEGGVWRDTGRIDATDSTAAVFLIALRETFAATRDLERLQTLMPAMRLSLDAIAATRDHRDGLYYALPGFAWKYTMDQAEVVAGFEAAIEVAIATGRWGDAAEARVAAAEVRAAVDRLWAPAPRAYDWGLHADGTRAQTAWWRFYPSATAQAWMVAFGLARPDRAPGMIAALQANHPDWDRPAGATVHDHGPGTTGYWPLISLAFARGGDPLRALTGATRIRAAAAGAGRVYPFTAATAGGLAIVHADPAVLALPR